MPEFSNHVYEFGEFQLEPGERRLLRRGDPVSLTPKAFDTLVFLVERAGHLVEKEELMSALWPDSFVEEANLAQHVFTLRKILGETPEGGQLIETVARKGFRFVAPVSKHRSNEVVTPSNDLFSARRVLVVILVAALIGLVGYILFRRKTPVLFVPSKTSASLVGVKSIAVLPFKPVSNDSRSESLEMGMTETLITHLSNLSQLVVRPLGAVRKYNDPNQDPIKVGHELQVDAVLDGSIQKVGDHVRITVRLINITDGTTLWAQQFDEKFTNIFDVQDSISERVANTLPLKLEGPEQLRLTRRYTENPEAYQLYLQAQYLWDNRTPENRQKMFQYYQQAIDRDPKFALAYVGMADLQIKLVGDNQIAYKEVKPSIAGNLAKALELDPELAQARNLIAEVKYQFDFDWLEAEKEFKKAIELNPNVASIRLAYGWYLMGLGRFDEASKEMERAQELDPHSMVINRSRGRLLYFMHRFDEAIDHFKRIVEAEPGVTSNHWVLAATYEQKRMYPEALEAYGRAAITEGANLKGIEADKEVFRVSGWDGLLRLRKERLLQQRTKGYASAMLIASVCAKLGEKEEAISWLNTAVDERSSGIPNLKVDPSFVSLHSDPRFGKLLERMNLKP